MITFMDSVGNETSLTDDEELIVCQILVEATELVHDYDMDTATKIENIVSDHLEDIGE